MLEEILETISNNTEASWEEANILKAIQPLFEEYRALKLLVEWAVDCDFGYDNIPQYEDYKEQVNGMPYTDGLIKLAKLVIESEEIDQ